MNISYLLALCRGQGARSTASLGCLKRLLTVAALSAASMMILSSPSQAETISPRRLLEVMDFSTPAVSPDGRRVAFRIEQASIERNTYDTVWYVQDMAGNAPPRRVADGGTALRDSAGGASPVSAVWSPDGRWIYYRALLDGRIDVWRAAADGSGAESLSRDPADVRGFLLSADGGSLLYSVGATREEVIEAEQTEYDRGIRIDETVPIGQPVFRSSVAGGRWATQRYNGVWFNRAPLLSSVADRWKSIDLKTGERSDLEPSDKRLRQPTASGLAKGRPEPLQMAFEPGSGRVALLTRAGDRQDSWNHPEVRLEVLATAEKANERIPCLAELCSHKAITNIQWRPDSDEVLFTVTEPQEGLAQSIFRWDIRSGAVHPVVHARGLLNGGRVRSSACGVSAEALVCVSADADRPPRLERIDLEKRQRHVLFDPNEALALDIAIVAPARSLRWPDSSGQMLTGWLFPARRTGERPPPLFVTYYSCAGFLRGGVGDEWPLAALAERGISALCINHASTSTDAIERYDQAVRAVESVVELLASQGEIDGSRVGMGGLSFGSEAALWTAIESDVLAAVSISSPVRTPNYYLFASLKGKYFKDSLRNLLQLGAPEETPERWRVLSPVFNLDRIKAPILMQMPEQEYLYALEYAIPLLRERRADLYVFPHEPHQKFQPRHKLAVYERNLEWFLFWLKDVEDNGLDKASQFTHWRLMRASMRERDEGQRQ